MVDHFMHLSSSLSRDGGVIEDVKCCIAKASRAFGCLRGSIFNNSILPLTTKRMVYIQSDSVFSIVARCEDLDFES